MLKKVLLLLCLSAQLIMNGQWKRVGGPNIGSVQEIFNSGSTLILYTINAGIFTSQDDGISWQESTSGLPCNHGVSAMAEGAGVLYAAINQGGIYVSLDQGKTWEARNDGIENLTFYSLEVDNDHVYAGNDAGGIYYSEDQGLHWENRSDGISTVRVVDILSHDTELYIASKEVFRSNDQGESWSQVVIPDLNPNGIRALLEHDGIFYASTEGAIYVSDDNMASWTKKNIAISGATINNLSSNGNKVFATTSNGRYMVSEDGGNTWSIEENPLTNRAVNHLFVWQGKYLLSTNDGLFSSSNNGMTWNPRTGDLNAAQIVSLFVNEEFVFAGTDVNGMFRYQKDTGLWTEINTGLDALNSYRVDDILFVNGELMIATGGGIYTSQDWGASWNRRFDPGINRSTQVLAENKGILITAVNGEGLYLSNDSGNTWTKTNNSGLAVNTSYSSIFFHEEFIVLSTHDPHVYISKDLGDTWTRISISSGFNFVYDVDYKDGVLYAATNNGLKISANLGETWSAYNSDKRLLTDIEFEGDNIYAAGEHGVLISNLKEKKWVEFCAGLGPIWSNVLLLDHEVIYNGTFSKGLWQQSLIKGSFTASNGINGIMADEIKLCPNSAPVDLFSKTGISPNSNGKWSPALKSNNGIFDPKLDAEGIYSFSMASAACDCEMLINVAVSLDNDSNAGQDTELDLCVNDGSFDLFDMVNGNPDVGGVWIPELKSGSNMFDPKFDKAGVYTYSLQTDDCGTDEAKVTIEIADVPDAGTGTEVTLCKSEPVINLFDFLEGSPDINGVWTPAVSGASGEFDPSKDKAGIYTYTVQTGLCEAVSQVKINLVGDAIGQIHSEIEFCTQAGTIDLFDYVGNDIPEGGTWEMLSGKENGHFDPLTDPEGLYVYKVTGFCGTSTVVFDLSVVEETAVSELVINSQGDGASNSIDIEFPQKDLFEYSLNGSDYQKWPRFENLSGGFYTVYGREINGCGRFVREVSILDYPKFFTPNGDGINDLWNLVGVVNESYSLYIFDKFGKYLKNLTEGHQGWDGNYNGRPLPSTDYWFRVEFAAGQTRTGHFSLRR